MTGPVDHYTRQISGAVQATRGRVLWRNGRLYVVTPVQRVNRTTVVFAAPDPPRRVSGARHREDWTSDAAGVRWRKGSCGCGFPGALKVSSQVIVNEADAALAAGTITLRGDVPADA